MDLAPLDRNLRRFHATREPEALAAVFDAAAPRLLLIAMHLVRDATAAEDLVQTVFLQVIRDIAGFDPAKPALPWLLGILQHRAIDLQRRAQHRREVAMPLELPEMAPRQRVRPLDNLTSGDPAEQAAAAELRERVADAVSGMPSDYRTILLLRLVHGLAPLDIAHVQGLPPATVRTRLRRGLELLRDALPRGLAAPGLMALLGAELLAAKDTLAAVRVKVLAAATPAAAAGLFGWLAGFLAALLAIAVGVWSWHEVAPVGPAGEVPQVDAAPEQGDPPGAAASPGAARAADERLAVVPPSALLQAPATVRGRCIDAATSLPIAGVTVSISHWPSMRRLEPGEQFDDVWQPPEPATSDAAGWFTFAYVPPAARSVEVVCRHPNYVLHGEDVGELRFGVSLDLGEIALQRGTATCLCLRLDGKPLAGVQVGISAIQGNGRPSSHLLFGPSDGEGRIDLQTLRPGQYHYELSSRHLPKEGVLEVPLRDSPWSLALELTMPPRERSVVARCLDTLGQPVAGVEFGLAAGPSGAYVANSDAEGRCLWSFPRLPEVPDDWRIRVWRAHPELELLDDGGPVRIGGPEVQLLVRRRASATLHLEVVDGQGRPVEDFGVRCWPDPWQLRTHVPMPALARPARSSHPGGVVVLRDLAAVPSFVSVFPALPYAELAELPVDLVEGQTTRLQLVARPPAALVVRLCAESDGKPLAGAILQLAKVVPATARDRITVGSFRSRLDVVRRGLRMSSADNVLVLGEATTDADGMVTLIGPPNTEGLVVFVGGDTCQPRVERTVTLPPEGGQMTIHAQRAGRLRGVIEPLRFVERMGPAPQRVAAARQIAAVRHLDHDELADERPEVVLLPPGVPNARALAEQHVAADGTFAFGGLPPGEFEVWVRTRESPDLGPLARVTVDASGSAEFVRLDLSRWLPGRAELQFAVDGALAAWEGGLLPMHASGSSGRSVRLQFDADGKVDAPWLLPGVYVPFVDFAATALDDRRPVLGDQRVVITADQAAAVRIDLQRRPLDLTLLDAQGVPCAKRRVALQPIDRPNEFAHLWQRLWTDGEGCVRLAVAPPGRLRVMVCAKGEEEPSVEVGVLSAEATTATLRVP